MNELNKEIRDAVLNAIEVAPKPNMNIIFECTPDMKKATEAVIVEKQIQDLLKQKSLEIQLIEVDRAKINETIGLNT